ncbi:hypothetical protein C1645_870104 [Glomus cerebriforme]|uniref:RING-type domain-containing protein n=1 Tax=Glomus cerebriforme TaxID=658196 RepID=A0A397TMN8_9GLOM|nr:hypothetical protein C1645_870104 [Glomus cerebriforme]
MFNLQRNNNNNNNNIRYISYPRRTATELPHHPNHPFITTNNNTINMFTRRSEPTTSSRQNLTSSTNQITKLVRRLANRNSSGSNISSDSRSSSLTRMQTMRGQATSTLTRSSTLIQTSTEFPSVSTNASSTESDPFPFHNPWLVPPNSTSSSNHASRDLINSTEQEYSLGSGSNLQSLNTSRPSSRSSRSSRSIRPSTPTPPPRPPPPASSDSFNSNINAIRDLYYNIIPLFHDPHSTNLTRLSNSSHHSIDQPSSLNQSTLYNDTTVENDPLNHSRYLIQNHSSREAYCFLSKLPSSLDDYDESKDFSSEKNSNNKSEYECEQQEQQNIDECYLCLEPLEFRGGRMIINPGCGHLLHMKCYLKYIKCFKEQCTLCKKDFGSWAD